MPATAGRLHVSVSQVSQAVNRRGATGEVAARPDARITELRGWLHATEDWLEAATLRLARLFCPDQAKDRSMTSRRGSAPPPVRLNTALSARNARQRAPLA